LEVDPPSREVRLRGRRIALSQKEFALLRTLASEPARVFTKDELLRSIWGFRTRGRDADAGQSRLPAAPQARRLRRPFRGQRVGRRLPARRCAGGGGGVSATAAAHVAAWLVTCGALGVVVLLRAELGRRAEVVARAEHELRGPLCAAGLALHGAGRDGVAGAWAEAVGLELERAGAALGALAGATAWPRGAWWPRASAGATPGRGGAWRPIASAISSGGDGATLSREPEPVTAPVDVAALVRAQSGPWAAAAPSVGRQVVVFAPAGAVLVRGDRGRLAQAVGNLLANAVEHGDGAIGLSVGCAGGVVRIEVTDEGRGLSVPLGRLVRGARAGRGQRGRGLAIVAGVAARHGGRLVTGPSRHGARLALELPAAGGDTDAITEAS
jgi:signal transduction histidine kinase